MKSIYKTVQKITRIVTEIYMQSIAKRLTDFILFFFVSAIILFDLSFLLTYTIYILIL